jgi:AcrR family transcriptional regulator
VREWLPVSTSPKGRLVLAAVTAFGARAFDEVTVGDLAAAANVTTGALYHHFGSKIGLYTFVRDDVEQRLLDRMDGAAAAVGGQTGGSGADRSAAVRAALLVGFDFAVHDGFLNLLGAPPTGSERDRLAELLGAIAARSPVLGRVLAAAWRAALLAVADGTDPRSARAALQALELRSPTAPPGAVL